MASFLKHKTVSNFTTAFSRARPAPRPHVQYPEKQSTKRASSLHRRPRRKLTCGRAVKRAGTEKLAICCSMIEQLGLGLNYINL